MLYVKEKLLEILKNDSKYTFDPVNDLYGETTLGIKVPTQIVLQKEKKEGGYKLYPLLNQRQEKGISSYRMVVGDKSGFYKGLEDSPGTKILFKQAKNAGLKFLYEVPVFIDDWSLWENCKREVGIPDAVANQAYFSLDVVTPNGQIIEIDGSQHSTKENQVLKDKARDLYFRKRYWIRVIRFQNYPKNPEDGFERIKRILELPMTGFPFMTNYDEIIWNSYYKRDLLTRKALDILLTGEERTDNRKVQKRIDEILERIKEEG